MKSIKILLFSVVISSLTSCGDSSTTTEQISNENPIAEFKKQEVELKNFTKEDVARFAMSSIMGQPSKKIKVQLKNNLYYVSYVRKSDSQKFSYKIKIDENTIVWANIDGRWRNSPYDEKLSFEESDNKLKITQIYSDKSVETIEYKKDD